MKKTVAIIIINFNTEKITQECLASVRTLKSKEYNLLVIVVDNGSKEIFPENNRYGFDNEEIKIIRSDVNRGFTGGNNIGIAYALEKGADYIMLLNSDTLVDKGLVKNLKDTLDSDERMGVAAPKIYFAKGYEYHHDRYKKEDLGKVIWYAGGIMDWANVIGHHKGVDEIDNGQFSRIEKTDYGSGCCIMIKREVFENVGQFDDRYFLYYEESDLCERIKRAGYSIFFVPSAFLWHKNAQSSGGSGSILQDYYITRNRMLFGMLYAPIRTRTALLRESTKLLIHGRPWQKKGIKDYFIRKFGKGSFNI